MKAFRGTLLAAGLLVLAAVLVLLVRPDLLGEPEVESEPRLFDFEKHELMRVDVHRPDGVDITLVENDGVWTIEGTGFVAGRSMVNRIKHQIHDLTARATVVENPDQPELYGLGDNAIEVMLTLRDGRVVEFMAGDPNPSSVSYYLQRKDDAVVYTVKKSAVDYYSLTLEEFRESRFVSFDSKDATKITSLMKGKPDLILERTGDREWTMHEPIQMAANEDRSKRLLGRISALKAKSFIENADTTQYGLAEPRARITIEFASQEPTTIQVGDDAPSDNKYEELAYVLVEGDTTVYVAKRGLLEEYGQDPMELRNRRVVEMKERDIVAVDVWLNPAIDEELEGEAGVRYAAEQWVWKDGVPVPGSTPKRVARRVAEVEVVEFIDDSPRSLKDYGLEEWRAKVVLTDTQSNEKVVFVGGEGEPHVNPEGRERKRYFAKIEGNDSVYLIDEGVLSVIEDMIREYNRKAKKDAEKAARRERIETVADEEEDG